MERHRIFAFRLRGCLFGLPLSVVREVAPYCTLSKPPICPPLLEGILNLAGEGVPVLRLDRLLQLPEGVARASSRLLIVSDPGGKFALLTDEVVGILEFEAAQLVQLAVSNTFNGCVTAQGEVGHEPLHLLSLERLMLGQEREALSHFMALEQHRRELLPQEAR